MRSTNSQLREFFFEGFGWLILLGHILFAVRTSTLWLSRGNDAVPSAKQILEIAWYWPAAIAGLLLLIILFGVASVVYENWRFRMLIDGDIAKFLEKVLAPTLAIPLFLGLLAAWAFGLDVFGGTFATVLTIIQIAAAALPLFAKLR